MGTTFLGSDCCVYARNKNGKYVKKDVSALQEGEEILWEEEFVKKTIGEIERALMTQERYKTAKSALHEINSKEGYVPSLRTHLLRGLCPATEENNRKILLEEEDFSNREYKEMVNLIRELMVSMKDELEIKPLSRAEIYKQLRGEVVAPEDSRMYKVYSGINPVFESAYKSCFPDGEITDLYHMYMAFRTGILSSLAPRKGNRESKERKPRTSYGKYKIGPERAAVIKAIEDFGEKIRKGVYPVKVKKVKKLGKSERIKAQETIKVDRKLTRGVYHRKEAPEGYECERLEDFSVVDVLGNPWSEIIPEKIGAFCGEHNFPKGDVKRYILENFDEVIIIKAVAEDGREGNMKIEGIPPNILKSKDPHKISDFLFQSQYKNEMSSWPNFMKAVGLYFNGRIPTNIPKLSSLLESVWKKVEDLPKETKLRAPYNKEQMNKQINISKEYEEKLQIVCDYLSKEIVKIINNIESA